MEMDVLSSVPKMKTLSGPLRFPFTAMYSVPAMDTGMAWSPNMSWQFPGGYAEPSTLSSLMVMAMGAVLVT